MPSGPKESESGILWASFLSPQRRTPPKQRNPSYIAKGILKPYFSFSPPPTLLPAWPSLYLSITFHPQIPCTRTVSSALSEYMRVSDALKAQFFNFPRCRVSSSTSIMGLAGLERLDTVHFDNSFRGSWRPNHPMPSFLSATPASIHIVIASPSTRVTGGPMWRPDRIPFRERTRTARTREEECHHTQLRFTGSMSRE